MCDYLFSGMLKIGNCYGSSTGVWSFNDNGLTQKVNEPTRNDILDLVLTKNPDSISNIKVVPGISDHDIVTASLSLDAQCNKKKLCKV